jgi:hypothetical protein
VQQCACKSKKVPKRHDCWVNHTRCSCHYEDDMTGS